MSSPRGILRTEAVDLIASVRNNSLTIVTMQPVAAWKAIGQHDLRNLNLIGSMGSASSIGLGLALAQPTEKVLVLDGDGSLVMQLGTMVSIGTHKPQNLHHIVFNNGCYETSGKQPVPGSATASLTEMALASGYTEALEIDDLTHAKESLYNILSQRGPTFTSLIINGQGEIPRAGTSHAVRSDSFIEQIAKMRASFSSP